MAKIKKNITRLNSVSTVIGSPQSEENRKDFIPIPGEKGEKGDPGVLSFNSVAEMRSMNQESIEMIKNGSVKGVQLNGYYIKGDTIGVIQYYLYSGSDVDDGGSVFEIGDIKLAYDFNGVVDIRYYGARPNSGVDVGSILVNIAKKYANSEVSLIGSYFLDSTITRVIGLGFSNKMVIIGGGVGVSKLNINTYTGDRKTSWNVSVSFKNISVDGMCSGRTVNKSLSSFLTVNNGFIENCSFDNFNTSIFIGNTGTTRIANNYFGWFTDHAIYYRNDNTEDTNNDTNLIISKNVFKGTNNIADYYNGSVSDPRHAVKIAGTLNNVEVTSNEFKGFGANILIDVGDSQSLIKKIVRNLLVDNNIFYTAYSSIEYSANLNKDSFAFSNTHRVTNNKFYSSDLLDYGSGGFTGIGHIYFREKCAINTLISGNFFYQGRSSVVATQLENNLHNSIIKGNVFNDSPISMRSVDSLVFKSNTVSNVTTYFFNNTLPNNWIIKDNEVSNCAAFIRSNLGGSDASRVVNISSNDFVNCVSVCQFRTYGLGFNWVNNSFLNCGQVFERVSGANTTLLNFKFVNNDVLGSTVYSLDSEINNLVNVSYSDFWNINGFKASTSRPVGSTGRKTGSVVYDGSTGKLGIWNSSKWTDVNGNSVDAKTSGTTSERPPLADVAVNFSFFDFTLGKPIFKKNNTTWVYADGSTAV